MAKSPRGGISQVSSSWLEEKDLKEILDIKSEKDLGTIERQNFKPCYSGTPGREIYCGFLALNNKNSNFDYKSQIIYSEGVSNDDSEGKIRVVRKHSNNGKLEHLDFSAYARKGQGKNASVNFEQLLSYDEGGGVSEGDKISNPSFKKKISGK